MRFIILNSSKLTKVTSVKAQSKHKAFCPKYWCDELTDVFIFVALENSDNENFQ